MENPDVQTAARFERHLFVCVNQRAPDSPKASCGACGEALRLRFVDLIAQHGLKGRVRASKALCLDACEYGPVVLVYALPGAASVCAERWYLRVGPEDAEAIFAASVLADRDYEPKLAQPADWQRLRELRAAEKRQKGLAKAAKAADPGLPSRLESVAPLSEPEPDQARPEA